MIRATVRHDDECGNGHNTFSITGEIYIPGRRDCEACGCIHEEIAKYFPELAPFLKYHLMSTDAPLHYIANTLYWIKGEYEYQLISGSTKLPVWTPELQDSEGNAVKMGRHDLIDSADCPIPRDVRLVYKPVMMKAGTPRNLANARSSACWPEATDEELLNPNLKQVLDARLPALLEAFKRDVESLNLIY
jgi:hypothetical protein